MSQLWFVPVHAADFRAAFKAHDRGDYATALIFQQLAEQGDAGAQFNLGGIIARHIHDNKGQVMLYGETKTCKV